MHPCFNNYIPKKELVKEYQPSFETILEKQNIKKEDKLWCFRNWKNNPNFNPDGTITEKCLKNMDME